MAVVLARLRSEARTRWRAWLGLAVIAGVVGGGIIAALAGARRTDTAYPRFLAGTRAFDVLVPNGGTTPENANRVFDFQQIRRLPEVEDATLLRLYVPAGTTPSGRPVGVQDIVTLGDAEGRFGRDMNQARVLEGRLPEAPDEVAVTFLAGDEYGLGVGDVLELQLAGPSGATPASEPFRIVGEVAMQGGFPPLTGGLPPLVLLSPAYTQAHPDAIEAFAIRLREGRPAIAGFHQQLNRLAAGEQVVAGDQIEITSAVQRSIGVQTTALRLLAAIVIVVALLLLAQAWARETALDTDDHPVLRALGMTPGQLRATAVARAVPVAVVAAGVSFLTSLALSPLAPLGVTGRAELHPGVALNAAYVGPGVAAVFLAVIFLAAVAAWWAARTARSARRGGGRVRGASRVAEALAGARLSAPAVSGVRMALESAGGRAGVPVRSTMISVVLGVATIAGVVCFSTSLGGLFDDPRDYGWNWDIQVGDAFAPTLGDEAEGLIHDPAVRAAAVGTNARLQLGSRRVVDALAMEPVRGDIAPAVVDGRAPQRPTEILLGTRTLRDLGAHVGSTVTVSAGDRTLDMEVVGRGVFIDTGSSTLGEGAAVTLAGLRRLVPETTPDMVLLRVEPTPAGRALVDRLRETKPANVYVPSKPADLTDLERVGGLPSVVAAIVTVMGAATLAHTLLTSVRRRRRDLAVLKVLGFVRSQVSATVAWQASIIGAVAVVVGLPLGVAGGRWAWHLFADQLGVPPQARTPVLLMVAIAAATLLLANLLAAGPGHMAARTQPSAILRSE